MESMDFIRHSLIWIVCMRNVYYQLERVNFTILSKDLPWIPSVKLQSRLLVPCQSANEYSIHSHAMPLQLGATQIPLDVLEVHRRLFENAHSGGAKHPKIVKCLRKDRQNLISTQFDSTCLYSLSGKVSQQHRIAACCFRTVRVEMRVALKLLSVVIARAQKPLRSSFDAFKLFTLRPRRRGSRVSFCACDTQLWANKCWEALPKWHIAPVISEGFKMTFE